MFVFEGNVILTCSCTAPTECDENPCQNGASCSLLTSISSCACLPGYGGSLCEVVYPIVCHPVCENGGSCVANDTCSCPVGYSGDRCTEPGAELNVMYYSKPLAITVQFLEWLQELYRWPIKIVVPLIGNFVMAICSRFARIVSSDK